MSNQKTPILECVISFLKKQKKPVDMKTIVAAVEKKFPDIIMNHTRVWNAVHNGCNFPTLKPHFNRKEMKNAKGQLRNHFSLNP